MAVKITERKRMRKLREDGWSLGVIAAAFGTSPSTIHRHTKDIEVPPRAGRFQDLRQGRKLPPTEALLKELETASKVDVARKYGATPWSIWRALKRYKEAHQ